MANLQNIPVIKSTGLIIKESKGVRSVALVITIFAALILFVWLRVHTNQLLSEIRILEDQLSRNKVENEKLENEVKALSSFKRIPNIAQNHLNMDYASRGEIIKIKKEYKTN